MVREDGVPHTVCRYTVIFPDGLLLGRKNLADRVVYLPKARLWESFKKAERVAKNLGGECLMVEVRYQAVVS